MSVRDRSLIEAIATYDKIHATLVANAKKAEKDRRPILATRLRYQASMVARAALAEELDPEPRQ